MIPNASCPITATHHPPMTGCVGQRSLRAFKITTHLCVVSAIAFVDSRRGSVGSTWIEITAVASVLGKTWWAQNSNRNDQEQARVDDKKRITAVYDHTSTDEVNTITSTGQSAPTRYKTKKSSKRFTTVVRSSGYRYLGDSASGDKRVMTND